MLESIDLIGGMADAELAIRVVRLLGEGARRTTEAALDVYGLAADAAHSRAAGLPDEEIYDRYLAPWSRLARLAPALAAWLHGRHLSAAIDAYSVDATEQVLEKAGFVPPRQSSPPAVAFVDLTGFTRLSEELGDQAAASAAIQLATLADEAARRHSGRVVKLLGDGVLLRFGGTVDAVEAVARAVAKTGPTGPRSGGASPEGPRHGCRTGRSRVGTRTVATPSRIQPPVSGWKRVIRISPLIFRRGRARVGPAGASAASMGHGPRGRR